MPTRSMFIPPGGFAGFAQQTAATQALLGTRGSRTTTRRRKKATSKRRKSSSGSRRRSSASRRRTGGTRRKSVSRSTGKSRKPAWMVKGSPAAKRRMAQLRKMRKKR